MRADQIAFQPLLQPEVGELGHSPRRNLELVQGAHAVRLDPAGLLQVTLDREVEQAERVAHDGVEHRSGSGCQSRSRYFCHRRQACLRLRELALRGSKRLLSKRSLRLALLQLRQREAGHPARRIFAGTSRERSGAGPPTVKSQA